VNVSDVRLKDMDIPYMELGTELTRANDSSSKAQQQEREPLCSLQGSLPHRFRKSTNYSLNGAMVLQNAILVQPFIYIL